MMVTPNQNRNRNKIGFVGFAALVGGITGLLAFGKDLSEFLPLLSATLAMAGFAFLVTALVMSATQLPSIVHALSAIAPVVPLGWLMAAHVKYIRTIDEMQRKIEMESVAIAALVTSLVYMAGGFLASAKIFTIDAGLVMLFVFPVLCVTYGIGKFFVIRHYS